MEWLRFPDWLNDEGSYQLFLVDAVDSFSRRDKWLRAPRREINGNSYTIILLLLVQAAT